LWRWERRLKGRLVLARLRCEGMATGAQVAEHGCSSLMSQSMTMRLQGGDAGESRWPYFPRKVMLPLRSVGPEGVRRRMVIGQRSHGHRPSRWRPWPRRSCDLPCTLARSHPPACYRHESQAHLGRGERHDEPGEQRPQAQGRGRRPPAAGEAQPLHLHCLVPSTRPPPMAMAMAMTTPH
jgi:hypothetical protein